MLLRKYKIETYTFQEYFNKDMREKIRLADKMIEHIKRNKTHYKRLIFLVALLLINDTKLIFASDMNLSAIDSLGNKMLDVVRVVGYWYSIIMCCVESIKSAMSGTTNNITSIIFKYSMLFGTFYFVPAIFDMIKSAF